MAVKIRLNRTGAKNQPSFRIVVADSSVKRDGKYLEIIGHFDPKTDPKKLVIDQERYQYWLKVGAQPTEAVRKLVK